MAGGMAAMSSIAYPSISSFVSAHASADQQGRWIRLTKISFIGTLSF